MLKRKFVMIFLVPWIWADLGVIDHPHEDSTCASPSKTRSFHSFSMKIAIFMNILDHYLLKKIKDCNTSTINYLNFWRYAYT